MRRSTAYTISCWSLRTLTPLWSTFSTWSLLGERRGSNQVAPSSKRPGRTLARVITSLCRQHWWSTTAARCVHNKPPLPRTFHSSSLSRTFSPTQDKSVAFKIFELGLKKYGDIPEYILAYIDYLSHLNGRSWVMKQFTKPVPWLITVVLFFFKCWRRV